MRECWKRGRIKVVMGEKINTASASYLPALSGIHNVFLLWRKHSDTLTLLGVYRHTPAAVASL